MANTSFNDGLTCKGVPLRLNAYRAGGTVYPGSIVKLDSDGNVVAATAGDACLGACVSYGVSGDTVMVADHPDQLFIIRADQDSVSAQTALNLNYNFVVTTADTLYKVARTQLDASEGATNSNYPLKALGLAARVGDSDFGTNAKVIVKINNHQLAGGTGTLGV